MTRASGLAWGVRKPCDRIGSLRHAAFASLFLLAVSPVRSEPPAPVVLVPATIANLPLGVVTLSTGKAFNLHVGIGSGAFRRAGDPPGRIWLLTDRGPNLDCSESRRLMGVEADQACSGDRTGRLLPLPGFVPAIYGVDLGPDNVARINLYFPLKGRSGKPLSGRPPQFVGRTESAPRPEIGYGPDGRALPPDPSGVDPEALVRLSDGSFWIAEEFGPSLLHVSADGTVLRRVVPAGSESDFRDADFEIVPALPALLRRRLPGRGFEGLAITPDEKTLIVAMQGPLAHPDPATGRASRLVRLLALDAETLVVRGQYLYALEPGGGEIEAPHLAELVALDATNVLVAERVDRTTRLYRFDLARAKPLAPEHLAAETRPTLESMSEMDLNLRDIWPVEKTLVLDSEKVPGFPPRVEGLAVLGPREIFGINDNEFGIEGGRTQAFRLLLPTDLPGVPAP